MIELLIENNELNKNGTINKRVAKCDGCGIQHPISKLHDVSFINGNLRTSYKNIHYCVNCLKTLNEGINKYIKGL